MNRRKFGQVALLSPLAFGHALDVRSNSTRDATPISPLAANPESDWPMHRGNPARTGETTSSGPVGSPVLKRKFETQNKVQASPAIAGGTVFVNSHFQVY